MLDAGDSAGLATKTLSVKFGSTGVPATAPGPAKIPAANTTAVASPATRLPERDGANFKATLRAYRLEEDGGRCPAVPDLYREQVFPPQQPDFFSWLAQPVKAEPAMRARTQRMRRFFMEFISLECC